MPSGRVWLSLRPWVHPECGRLAIQSIQSVQTFGRVARPWGRAVGGRTKAPRNTVSCLGFLLSLPLFSFSLLSSTSLLRRFGDTFFLHSVLQTHTGQDPLRFLICCCSLSIFALTASLLFFLFDFRRPFALYSWSSLSSSPAPIVGLSSGQRLLSSRTPSYTLSDIHDGPILRTTNPSLQPTLETPCGNGICS